MIMCIVLLWDMMPHWPITHFDIICLISFFGKKLWFIIISEITLINNIFISQMNTKCLLVDPFYRFTPTHQYSHNTTPLPMLWLRKIYLYLMATEAGVFSLHEQHKEYKHLKVYFHYFNEPLVLPSKRIGPKIYRDFVQNPNCDYVGPISPGVSWLTGPVSI